ncbi:MAG TPA: hypothetical protein PKL04_06040 [Methanofastidiosum sp.]|nr:hypothetical protein [Methanofastidiosum sp.]
MKYNFPIKSKEFFSRNILEADVGSNCPCGGDGGHGGKTYLKITDGRNTGWNIKVKDLEEGSIFSLFYGDTINVESYLYISCFFSS